MGHRNLGRERTEAARAHGHIHSVEFCPASPLLATGAYDGTLLLDRTSSFPRSLTIGLGSVAHVVHLAFTPEGRYVVSGNDNGTISILKAPACQRMTPVMPRNCLTRRSWPSDPAPQMLLQRADIPPALLQQAAASAGGVAPPELVAILPYGDKVGITSVAISHDGKMLAAAGGNNHSAKIWDLATGKLLHDLPHPAHMVYEAVFVPMRRNGDDAPPRLATACGGPSHTAKLWDVETGKEVHTLKGHVTEVYRLAASPDGAWLASADMAGIIHVWDPATGKRLQTLRRPPGEWGDITASPDGRFLATADADGVVRLWDPLNGWLLATLAGHPGSARGLAFLANGLKLASSSNNERTIRLWDLASSQQTKLLDGDALHRRQAGLACGRPPARLGRLFGRQSSTVGSN